LVVISQQADQSSPLLFIQFSKRCGWLQIHRTRR
jgi:hypothetical protein